MSRGRRSHRLRLGARCRQQTRAGEFPYPHRLAEQIALDLVEAQAVGGEEVGAGFDPLGQRTRAVVVGELDDVAADRLLQPVIARSR